MKNQFDEMTPLQFLAFLVINTLIASIIAIIMANYGININ